MKLNFLLILSLFLLNSCSAPGTVFLGPILTGAKTGSIYQASLSYGTGKIVNEITTFNTNDKIKLKKIISSRNMFSFSAPAILNTYAIKTIEISEVVEPEPLP